MKANKILAWILILSIIPIFFEIIMFMAQTPMPRVEQFPLYVQPIIWGLIVDAFGILLFLGIKWAIDKLIE